MILFGWVLWYINHWRIYNTNPLYTYILNIYDFGWILWHMNHCRLFNTKSFIYIHILNIRFVNTFCRWHFKTSMGSFFSFCTQLNCFKYFYSARIIPFAINHFSHTFEWIYIYDLQVNSLLVISFVNELVLLYLDSSIASFFFSKGFQLSLSNTNNFIQY